MPVVGEATDLLPAPPPGFILPRLNISTQQGVELRCRPDLFSSEYASSPTSVGIGAFDVGCSLLGDLRFGRRCFIPVGGELVRTPDLTIVVSRGMAESYGGRAIATVWGEGVTGHITLMAHGGVGQDRTQTPPPRMLGLRPT
ncbi:hypothetical protein GW17_00061219 [Ensete ventricosum]|nr:hypothetical protein GW17_00061219 [Ensete ventricosum]